MKAYRIILIISIITSLLIGGGVFMFAKRKPDYRREQTEILKIAQNISIHQAAAGERKLGNVSYGLVTTALFHGHNDNIDWIIQYVKNDNISVTINVADKLSDYIEDFPYILDKTGDDLDIKYIVNPFRAQECPGYLNYIIDNYKNLPDYSIFLHADPEDHNINIFNDLENVMDEINMAPETHVPFTHLNNHWVRRNAIEICDSKFSMFIQMLGFDEKDIELLKDVDIHCCAQFVVHRDSILRYSLEFYKVMKKLSYENSDCACYEHIWAYIFTGKNILTKDEVIYPRN